MARLRLTESAEASDTDTLYRDPSIAPRLVSGAPQSRPSSRHGISPSPTIAASSDKENRQANSISKPPISTSGRTPSHSNSEQRVAKRRRVDEFNPRQPLSKSEEHLDAKYYDPNQDSEERRETRKGLRKVYKDICDNKVEYLQPESTGLQDALSRLNGFQSTVKQTSDATIDSRTLVDVGDLTYKKTQRLILGDSVQGIDIDEFVSKCITFMRRGDDPDKTNTTATQRRSRRTEREYSDDEEHDLGDALNWAWLGTHACLGTNSRPGVSSFLLGPLSTQKKPRMQRLRRERLQAAVTTTATQPQELRDYELEQAENSSLVGQCRNVLAKLKMVESEGQARASEEYSENMSSEQEAELLRRHHLCDDSGVSLFEFAVNPRSFAQTVENLFYISFLIKDGYVGIANDSRGVPTLHITASNNEDEEMNRNKQSKKHQGVFSVDYGTWKDLIELYKIDESLIPHRADSEAPVALTSGQEWY